MPRGKLCPLYKHLYQLEDVNSVWDTGQSRPVAGFEPIHKSKNVAVAVQGFGSNLGAIYSDGAIFEKYFAIGEQRAGIIGKTFPQNRLWCQQSHH